MQHKQNETSDKMTENNTKKIKAAFFDIDGTLTSERTWKGYIDYFHKNGKRRWTYLAFIGFHYSLYILHRIGLISVSSFRGAWAANLSWFVRNVQPKETKPIWDWTVDYLKPHWRTDTRRILEQHLKAGDLVMLVSSAPIPLVKRIAQELGVEHAIGTRLEIQNGHYTGRSLRPVCIDTYKASLTKEYLKTRELNIDFENSAAYADSITDLPLLEMTDNPVAVYPDETLKTTAERNGWKIIIQ